MYSGGTSILTRYNTSRHVHKPEKAQQWPGCPGTDYGQPFDRTACRSQVNHCPSRDSLAPLDGVFATHSLTGQESAQVDSTGWNNVMELVDRVIRARQ